LTAALLHVDGGIAEPAVPDLFEPAGLDVHVGVVEE
jgi:hypothetical protein